MESVRLHKVRLDIIGKREFVIVTLFSLFIIIGACVVGAFGPPTTITEVPNAGGAGLAFSTFSAPGFAVLSFAVPLPRPAAVNLFNSTCNSDVSGHVVPATSRCWQRAS